MPSLELYWDLGSQPSRAIKALLEAGGVEHVTHNINLVKGEHKAPEIIALNPAGQVPFIVMDGQTMVESSSILRYLACKYESLNKFYPDNLEQRQKIDAMLDFNATSFRPAFVAHIGPNVMKAIMKTESVTPA